MAHTIYYKQTDKVLGSTYYDGSLNRICFQCDVDQVLLQELCEYAGKEIMSRDEDDHPYSGSYLLSFFWKGEQP